jgi:hypothetical protein
MLAKNLGGLDERHLRGHGSIGPDLQRQTVIVRLLADTRFLDLVLDTKRQLVQRAPDAERHVAIRRSWWAWLLMLRLRRCRGALSAAL